MSREKSVQSHRIPQQRPGQVGGKRDANRRRRIEALQKAALGLFLEKGIEGTTIDDIVAAAGVAKGSFYRYFRDKEDLVEQVLAPVSEAVIGAMERCEKEISRLGGAPGEGRGALSDAYHVLGVELASVMLSHVDVVRLYLHENRAPAIGARRPVRAMADAIAERTYALTASAQRQGLLRPFDPRISGLAVIGAIEQILGAVLSGEDLGAPETIADSLISLILDGLRPNPS